MRRVLAAAVLAFVTFTLAGCTDKAAPPTDRFEVFAVSDRRPAPQLQGELLDGSGTYDAGADDGKILVVNFWGSWCGPCVDEAPELEAVYTARADEGVSFVGINVRDEVDNARAFAAQHFTYPSIFDPSSRLALDFAVAPNAIPSTIVIDRQGRIAAIARGSVYYSDLDPLVAELLAEAG
jgi:thiol-disulfide isomerase/thioredoxin